MGYISCISGKKATVEYSGGKMPEITVDDFSNTTNAVLSLSLPEKQSIGEYTGCVSCVNIFCQVEKEDVKVIVEDTTPPVIKEEMPDELYIEAGIPQTDWSRFFIDETGETPYVTDIQEFTFDFSDAEKLDTSTSTTTAFTLKVTDESGNQANKDIKVNLLSSFEAEHSGKLTTYLTSNNTSCEGVLLCE